MGVHASLSLADWEKTCRPLEQWLALDEAEFPPPGVAEAPTKYQLRCTVGFGMLLARELTRASGPAGTRLNDLTEVERLTRLAMRLDARLPGTLFRVQMLVLIRRALSELAEQPTKSDVERFRQAMLGLEENDQALRGWQLTEWGMHLRRSGDRWLDQDYSAIDPPRAGYQLRVLWNYWRGPGTLFRYVRAMDEAARLQRQFTTTGSIEWSDLAPTWPALNLGDEAHLGAENLCRTLSEDTLRRAELLAWITLLEQAAHVAPNLDDPRRVELAIDPCSRKPFLVRRSPGQVSVLAPSFDGIENTIRSTEPIRHPMEVSERPSFPALQGDHEVIVQIPAALQ